MWLNQRSHVIWNVAMQQVPFLMQCPFSSYRKPATSLTESIKSYSLETWKSCSLLEHLGGIIGKLHYGIKWVEPAILTSFSFLPFAVTSTFPAAKYLKIDLWQITSALLLNYFLMCDRPYCYNTVNWVWVSEEALEAFSTEIHQNKKNAMPNMGRNNSKDLWVITVSLT